MAAAHEQAFLTGGSGLGTHAAFGLGLYASAHGVRYVLQLHFQHFRFLTRDSTHCVGGHMAGQGSAGNVIAALCSFFVPGLGQVVQGRLLMAVLQFVLACVLWFFLLGWIIHLWSILDAALWKPKEQPVS